MDRLIIHQFVVKRDKTTLKIKREQKEKAKINNIVKDEIGDLKQKILWKALVISNMIQLLNRRKISPNISNSTQYKGITIYYMKQSWKIIYMSTINLTMQTQYNNFIVRQIKKL